MVTLAPAHQSSQRVCSGPSLHNPSIAMELWPCRKGQGWPGGRRQVVVSANTGCSGFSRPCPGPALLLDKRNCGSVAKVELGQGAGASDPGTTVLATDYHMPMLDIFT